MDTALKVLLGVVVVVLVGIALFALVPGLMEAVGDKLTGAVGQLNW